MAWSPDETKLMYLAEKKPARAKPFVSSAYVTKSSTEDGILRVFLSL